MSMVDNTGIFSAPPPPWGLTFNRSENLSLKGQSLRVGILGISHLWAMPEFMQEAFGMYQLPEPGLQ